MSLDMRAGGFDRLDDLRAGFLRFATIISADIDGTINNCYTQWVAWAGVHDNIQVFWS